MNWGKGIDGCGWGEGRDRCREYFMEYSAWSISKCFYCNKINVIFFFTFFCGTSKMWPQRSVKIKIYDNFYIKVKNYHKNRFARFFKWIQTSNFFSIWAVLRCIVFFLFTVSHSLQICFTICKGWSKIIRTLGYF